MLNDEQRENLSSIRRKCKIHQQVNHKAASRYEMAAPSLLIPLVAVNACLSIVSSTEGLNPNIVAYLLGANAVLIGLKEMLKLNQRAEYHAAAANEYGKLAHDIERFTLRRHMNETPVEVFQNMSSRYTELMSKAVFLVPRLWTRHLRKGASDVPQIYLAPERNDAPSPYAAT